MFGKISDKISTFSHNLNFIFKYERVYNLYILNVYQLITNVYDVDVYLDQQTNLDDDEDFFIIIFFYNFSL